MTSGYSGTPLATKLSLRPGLRAWWEDVPPHVLAELAKSGAGRLDRPEAPIEAAHIFVRSRDDLEARVRRLRPLLASAGFLWVSWPKKSAKVPTDISEDVVREVALPTGLVDVKVCSIDETWSALKLMIRRALRNKD